MSSAPPYSWYVVFVLMACYTLSFIDRQILSLLVGPIKADLGVSDTSIGLLQGLAFALFYTLLGLPMGRMADRGSRRNLIAAGILVWSLMTALCAVAKSYTSLFLARLGVGVGESSLSPAALSLLSDYFPRAQLGTALSIYSMGIFFGAGTALIVGGSIVSAVSTMAPVVVPFFGAIAAWRLTFVIVGLPGLLTGLFVYTIREPGRRNALTNSTGETRRLTTSEVIAQVMLRRRSVTGIALGLSAQAMCTYAQQAWLPSYFIRVHHWTAARTGGTLGVMVLITGCTGMMSGGWLCDYWRRRGLTDAPLRVGVFATIAAGLFFCSALVSASLTATLALLWPGLFFLAMPIGSSYAALQLIFPNQLRGQVSALLMFALNAGGLTLGPLLTGVLNDRVYRNGAMVGYSLAWTIALGSALAALLFGSTCKAYRRDIYATGTYAIPAAD